MKHAPLRGLRCFPCESTGSRSGKCGWAFHMANLPGPLDVIRPVCADTALAASMRPGPAPGRGSLEGPRRGARCRVRFRTRPKADQKQLREELLDLFP